SCWGAVVAMARESLAARVRAPVSVLEPHDVFQLRSRDLEDDGVFERADAVDSSGREMEGAPGRNDLRVDRLARIPDLELDPSRVDVEGLVLLLVELETQLLPRLDEE